MPITARLVANLLEVAGTNRVLSVDFHAGQIQGFFNIPVDELTAVPMLARQFKEREFQNIVVAATDTGGAKRARDIARILNAPIAIAEKQRSGNDDKVKESILIGDVKGKTALIVDDEISTGGTIISTIDVLEEHGVQDIYCAASHGILCDDAPGLLAASAVKEIFVTDTLPVPDGKRNGKTTVLSVAPLLGEAIHRIHMGLSIGAMFEA